MTNTFAFRVRTHRFRVQLPPPDARSPRRRYPRAQGVRRDARSRGTLCSRRTLTLDGWRHRYSGLAVRRDSGTGRHVLERSKGPIG